MIALKVLVIIEQGATFSRSIEIADENDNPVDLSDYTARAQMRATYDTLNVFEITTAIAEDPTTGVVNLSLTPQETANIPGGRYVFDVELEHVITGEVTRIIQGQITCNPEVTKSIGD